MPEPGSIAVVIPTHNRCELLRRTLSRTLSLMRDGTSVVVFADACTDGTLSMLKGEFPGVEVVSVNEKVGYAVARNRVFRECGREFVLSLDDDSWPLDADFGGIIRRQFARVPEAAFLAGNVHDQQHPDGAVPVGVS